MGPKTDEFDYVLPRELIAQHPQAERSASCLLALQRSEKQIEHGYFRDVTGYLREGDVLVLNNTKVMPARLLGRKPTGGGVEILLTEKIDDRRWFCIVGGVKRGPEEVQVDVEGTAVRLVAETPFWTAEFPEGLDGTKFMAAFGRMPLPHYIKRGKNEREVEDYERYQTVYAQSEGSIAAPTAGLHFDDTLLKRIEKMGVRVVTITLHIGIGTFFLIKTEYVEEHEMHREAYSLPADALKVMRDAKERGGRVIAVGTSVVRTLETAWAGANNGASQAGYTQLFIYPGYRFKVVDALITNFHLPRSTPLMLICAFAGKEAVHQAYREAIERRYRFYSYGDAMFVS